MTAPDFSSARSFSSDVSELIMMGGDDDYDSEEEDVDYVSPASS